MKCALSRRWTRDESTSQPPDALHDWYPCLKNRAGAAAANPVATSKITHPSRIASAPRFATVACTIVPPRACSTRAEITTSFELPDPKGAASSRTRAAPTASINLKSIRDKDASAIDRGLQEDEITARTHFIARRVSRVTFCAILTPGRETPSTLCR